MAHPRGQVGDNLAEMDVLVVADAKAAVEERGFIEAPRIRILDPAGQIARHGRSPRWLCLRALR
jgi:hypothetical protein